MSSNLTGRYTYELPWQAYALAWAVRPEPRFRLAVGSLLEQERNFIRVIELNEETQRLEKIAEAEITFPSTKLMWKPTGGAFNSAANTTMDGQLLASSGTALDLWRLQDGCLKPVAMLKTARTQLGQAPPLTSFDWNSLNEVKLGVSSVDTTCSIFDIERQKIETQLIAHDKAVYDIGFGHACAFASVGADGSLRLFDQRNLEHSTIMYETSPPTALLRLAWNKHNTNYIATLAADAVGVTILDIRRPGLALLQLTSHGSYANTVAWAPSSRHHLICGTDDGMALIWDMREGTSDSTKGQTRTGEATEPVLSYETGSEVYQVQWPESLPDHVALGTSRHIEVLRT